MAMESKAARAIANKALAGWQRSIIAPFRRIGSERTKLCVEGIKN
jgi:hypothetical protein